MLAVAWIVCLQAQVAPIDKYSADLFSWMGSLGYQDDLRKPFVRIEDAGDDRQEWRRTLGYGFLVADNPASFDVLIPSLSIRTYYKAGCTSTPANFPSFVHGYLNSRGHNRTDEDAWLGTPWVGFGFESTLAWICNQRGMKVESKELAALGRPNGYTESAGLTKASAEDERQSIAGGVYSDLILRFEDAQQSRPDLLMRFKSFATRFRETANGKSASEVCDLIQEMVREDEKHVGKENISLADLTQDERVAELVWRLRDSNRTNSGEDDASERKLVDIGFPAVPRLLDALHDRRFTRSVSHPFSGPPVEYREDRVTRVRDVAKRVLEQIARRDFRVDDWRDAAGVEKLARAWWAFLKSNEEVASLAKASRRGDANSSKQAELLVETSPQSAFESIKEGVKNARDPRARAGLVLALAGLHSPEADAFVRQVAAEDKRFEPRFAAAQVLANRDPETAISIVEKEWERAIGTNEISKYLDLIPFLVESQKPSATRWMTQHLKTLDSWYRVSVLESYFNGVETPLPTRFAPTASHSQELGPESKKELFAAVEDLLGGELEDREHSSEEIVVGDIHLSAPEMSEVAEYALAACFPDVYQFDQPKSLLEKNRLRVTNLNAYRSRRGLAPAPMPSRVDKDDRTDMTRGIGFRNRTPIRS